MVTLKGSRRLEHVLHLQVHDPVARKGLEDPETVAVHLELVLGRLVDDAIADYDEALAIALGIRDTIERLANIGLVEELELAQVAVGLHHRHEVDEVEDHLVTLVEGVAVPVAEVGHLAVDLHPEQTEEELLLVRGELDLFGQPVAEIELILAGTCATPHDLVTRCEAVIVAGVGRTREPTDHAVVRTAPASPTGLKEDSTEQRKAARKNLSSRLRHGESLQS